MTIPANTQGNAARLPDHPAPAQMVAGPAPAIPPAPPPRTPVIGPLDHLSRLPRELVENIASHFEIGGKEVVRMAATGQALRSSVRDILESHATVGALVARAGSTPPPAEEPAACFDAIMAGARALPSAQRFRVMEALLARPDNRRTRYQSVLDEATRFGATLPIATEAGTALMDDLVANTLRLGLAENDMHDVSDLLTLVLRQTPAMRAESVAVLVEVYNTIDEPADKHALLMALAEVAVTTPAAAQPELVGLLAAKAVWLRDDEFMADVFTRLLGASTQLPAPHAAAALEEMSNELLDAASRTAMDRDETEFPLYLEGLVRTSEALPLPMRLELLEALIKPLRKVTYDWDMRDRVIDAILPALDTLPPEPRESIRAELEWMYT
jgi:hypothetical protein